MYLFIKCNVSAMFAMYHLSLKTSVTQSIANTFLLGSDEQFSAKGTDKLLELYSIIQGNRPLGTSVASRAKTNDGQKAMVNICIVYKVTTQFERLNIFDYIVSPGY